MCWSTSYFDSQSGNLIASKGVSIRTEIQKCCNSGSLCHHEIDSGAAALNQSLRERHNIFKDLRVKRDRLNGDIFVNTAKDGSTISPAEDFKDPLAITGEIPDEYINTTVVGEIIAIERVDPYLSCWKCEKQIELSQGTLMAECKNCHIVQKASAWKQNWFAQVLFQTCSSERKKLTLIQEMIDIIKEKTGNESTVDKASIHALLLYLLQQLKVTYHKKSRVITDIILP